jgi:sugar transferase EpsL
VWYVDHHTFLLDIKILLLTLVQVFKRHGIQETGHVTASEFMGTASKTDENDHE